MAQMMAFGDTQQGVERSKSGKGRKEATLRPRRLFFIISNYLHLTLVLCVAQSRRNASLDPAAAHTGRPSRQAWAATDEKGKGEKVS